MGKKNLSAAFVKMPLKGREGERARFPIELASWSCEQPRRGSRLINIYSVISI